MGLILLNPYQSSAMFYGPAKQAASRFTQGFGQYGQGLMRSISKSNAPMSGWKLPQQTMSRSLANLGNYMLTQSQKFGNQWQRLGNQLQKFGNQWRNLSLGDRTALMTTPMASLWLFDKSGLRQKSLDAVEDIKVDWQKLMAGRKVINEQKEAAEKARQEQKRAEREKIDAIRSPIWSRSLRPLSQNVLFFDTIPVGTLFFSYVDRNTNETLYFIEGEGGKNLFWDIKNGKWYEGKEFNDVRKARGQKEVYLAEYGEWERD